MDPGSKSMRRHAFFAAAAVVLVAPALAVRADDDKAVSDYKAIETWLEGQKPKTVDERKAVRVELEKRLGQYLKDHPAAGKPTVMARNALAVVFEQDGKPDDAIKAYEENLKSGEDEYEQKARYGIIKSLVEKNDLAGARKRLDGFMKDKPDEATLKDLDAYLKKRKGAAKPPVLKVGQQAPALKVKLTDEKALDIADLKGKVVLVDFWATWCPPCKKDLPMLKKLYAELKDKGFEIVGVDCFEKDPAAFKTFIEQEKIAWPQVAKEDGKTVAQDYGVVNLPRTVVLGKKGEIAALDLRGDELAAAIRAVIDGKPVPKAKGIQPGDKPAKSDDE
jgi:thiol-disulfide isomerase/thioredoxin